MTALVALLPVLLIISLSIIFVVVSKGVKFTKNFWTVKKIFIGISCYIVLGLLALLYLSISDNEQKRLLSKTETERLVQEENKFWEIIAQNSAKELKEEFLIDEKTYELPTSELILETSSGQYNGVEVLVKYRDDPNSNKIYAKTYQIPSVYESIDVTNMMDEQKMELLNNKLVIYDRAERQFSFYKFNPSIQLVEQYFSKGLIGDFNDSSIIGLTILYLNVPNHVTIIDKVN
ncbi:hypothetical protein ACH0B5_09310 [Ureibacillus sp. 179-F W5.1 NHS]|mgnify:CR=1 FL=1|uniref:Uncharacterized protein n=1 Tax=Lysinibacillus halotolerans TaxID=1368476 RepID=A0A3M8H6H9_9BACI|nr:hypothetical protein [Lysinibacillus halotolerans]RNC97996.1 hypothetical protein EC501_12865 [Lysinibacillus halotolerans]